MHLRSCLSAFSFDENTSMQPMHLYRYSTYSLAALWTRVFSPEFPLNSLQSVNYDPAPALQDTLFRIIQTDGNCINTKFR